MAKNWSAAEAIKVIREGKDKAAISDIGKRFPLFAVLAASNPVGIVEALPEYISARKVEISLKGDVETSEETSENEEEDEEEEEPKPKKKSIKAPAKAPAKSTEKKSAKSPAKKKPADDEEEDDDEDWEI